MFKIALFSLTLMLFTNVSATSQVNTTLHKAVFTQGLLSGDLQTAITAANYLIAVEPASPYIDSVAILYFNGGNTEAAYYWVAQSLGKRPKNFEMLELKAMCLQKTGKAVEAIEAYNALYVLQHKAIHAYQVMCLQYQIRRILECALTAQQVIQNGQIDSNIVIDYSPDGKSQYHTPLAAAIYNVYGAALTDLKRHEDARAAFEEALKMDKNFILASRNLQALKQAEQEAPAGKGIQKP